MNTRSMRLPPRRGLTANQSRKNNELVNSVKRPSVTWTQIESPASFSSSSSSSSSAAAAVKFGSAQSTQLLAGYLACEFLTNQTLFGETLGKSIPMGGARAVESRKRSCVELKTWHSMEVKRRKYAEISRLLKESETHLTDVVNPSQLAGIVKF